MADLILTWTALALLGLLVVFLVHHVRDIVNQLARQTQALSRDEQRIADALHDIDRLDRTMERLTRATETPEREGTRLAGLIADAAHFDGVEREILAHLPYPTLVTHATAILEERLAHIMDVETRAGENSDWAAP